MCILNTNVCMIRMSVIFFSRHAFCNTFSTHDLSWRSTFIFYPFRYSMSFSTHDLSWRSTLALLITPNELDFSTHDLSWRSTPLLSSSKSATVFQLTTSRGGRRLFKLPISKGNYFSTHDLSWRSTLNFCFLPFMVSTFQLTTSRGGRHNL